MIRHALAQQVVVLAMCSMAAHGVTEPVCGEADERRCQHDEREGVREKEQRDEGHSSDHDGQLRFQGAAADTQHGLMTTANTAALTPKNKPATSSHCPR